MIDSRNEELIQREADSVLSPSELAELSEISSRDHAVAEARESLRIVREALDSTPEIDPPARLREEIMEAVRSGPVVHSVAEAAVARPAFGRKDVFRVVYGLAAGIIVGLLIGAMVMGQGSPIDESLVSGTIARPVPADRSLILEIPVVGADLAGNIALSRAEDGVVLQLDFTSGPAITTTIEFDEGELRSARGDRSGLAISSGPGRVDLRSDGPESLQLEFATDDRKIPVFRISVHRQDIVVFEGSIGGDQPALEQVIE